MSNDTHLLQLNIQELKESLKKTQVTVKRTNDAMLKFILKYSE